jgi:hypothetical protein
MKEFFRRLFGLKEPEPEKALCQLSNDDCFPSRRDPGTLCSRGYCMVHCPCVCRGRHTPPHVLVVGGNNGR